VTRILLGFNCNCFTNRYDEPEEWTRVCTSLGIRHVMFNVDLIDPYWPWELQRKLCDRTLNACEKHGVAIRCSFGGHNGHQHYLGHPDTECRREAEGFFRRAIKQTVYLGGRSFGACFAILSERCHCDPVLRREIIADAVHAYHRLAEYGAELGLGALAYEMTSVPRESCATFEENDYVLSACSRMAIPMRICLDLGHRFAGGTKEERDHLAWIRRYGSRCDVIDCQQTDEGGSRHWPFTREYNAKGIIRGEEVVKAIQESGADEILLAFEVRIPAFHPHELGYIKDLEESVAHWRKWVKD
jgi:hypothetical protein